MSFKEKSTNPSNQYKPKKIYEIVDDDEFGAFDPNKGKY